MWCHSRAPAAQMWTNAVCASLFLFRDLKSVVWSQLRAQSCSPFAWMLAACRRLFLHLASESGGMPPSTWSSTCFICIARFDHSAGRSQIRSRLINTSCEWIGRGPVVIIQIDVTCSRQVEMRLRLMLRTHTRSLWWLGRKDGCVYPERCGFTFIHKASHLLKRLRLVRSDDGVVMMMSLFFHLTFTHMPDFPSMPVLEAFHFQSDSIWAPFSRH